jgi:HPt (histidine-containing phosphotransfer) domain-containing protein
MERGSVQTHGRAGGAELAQPQHVIFDVAFFEHCTMGDRQLMSELIGLFRDQVEKTANGMMEINSDKDWRFQAHTLKGAAAAIGAVEIETLASAWESRSVPRRYSEREALRETLAQVSKNFFAKAEMVLS